MKIIQVFGLLCFGLFLNSCFKDKEEDTKIRVMNNSNDTIYMSFTTEFPDTLFIHMSNPLNNPQFSLIRPSSMQDKFYNSPSKGIFSDKIDTLSVFIFSKYVLMNYQWDIVKSKYMILKRYDLGLNDLEKLNWIVTYP
jgi:hypothetical protein